MSKGKSKESVLENKMAVSYNRLWKLLIDRKISPADLRKSSGVAPNTMTKLRKDEEVSLGVLEKICFSLGVDFGDIIEYVSEENRLNNNIVRKGEQEKHGQEKGI